ncbi:MAG TPA: pentapeptide repeat-containing protein [Jatrophihabitantaceae bacterium]|nr:pentapeptide repeat-containing protein [Jatrophihabitantaceae bacterium]
MTGRPRSGRPHWRDVSALPEIAPRQLRAFAELDPNTRNRELALGGGLDDPSIDELEIEASLLDSVRIIGGRLAKLSLTDCELVDCDWSGVDLADARWDRTHARRCRLAGCAFPGSVWAEVSLSECAASRMSLRFSTLRSVSFTDCDLSLLDLVSARLQNVTFTRCTFAGALFADLQLRNVRFTECDLSGARGVASLRGVTVDDATLATMAAGLALDAGIVVA